MVTKTMNIPLNLFMISIKFKFVHYLYSRENCASRLGQNHQDPLKSLKIDVINFFLFCIASLQQVGLSCGSDQNLCKSDKNALVLGVTHHNTGPTHKKVLLATETQDKQKTLRTSVFGLLIYRWDSDQSSVCNTIFVSGW